MSNQENENGEDKVRKQDRYQLACTLAFIILVASLFASNSLVVKLSLVLMLVVRSYGLLFMKLNREWIALILYSGIYLYYSTQVHPVGLL